MLKYSWSGGFLTWNFSLLSETVENVPQPLWRHVWVPAHLLLEEKYEAPYSSIQRWEFPSVRVETQL
jgi:hypothetical protein